MSTKADLYARLKEMGGALTSSQLKKITKPELQAMLDERASNVVTMRKRSKGVNFPAKDALRACRAGSKQAALIDALARPEGATIDDLVRATGWRDANTAKSGLYWDVKQKGYGVRTESADDGTQRYHLVLPEGVEAPLPHSAPRLGAS